MAANNTIYWNNEPSTILNRRLIIQKGLDQVRVDRIRSLHKMRILLEKRMNVVDDRYVLDLLLRAWTENQFQLQEAWGFERDEMFHKPWYIEGCSCPSLDCDANYPYGPYFINKNCKIHGEKNED